MNKCKQCKVQYKKVFKNQCYCGNYCAYFAEKELKKIRNKSNPRRNKEYTFRKKFMPILMEKFNSKCVICNTSKDLTIDHIKPQIVKGGNNIDNLRLLCRSCNSKEFHKLVILALFSYFKNK